MRINKYTKIPIDDSGENFLYIKNHCLGMVVSSDGAPIVHNIRTGESFSKLALYEQIVDESGKELSDPLTGDNDDYYMTINGQEKMLVQYFKELNEYSASAEEKKEKEEDQRMKNEQS